jgi:hypothetical protein
MPYLIAQKELKIVCISYTENAAHDLVYELIDRGWKLEPCKEYVYLDRIWNGGRIQTMYVDANTGKINI